MRNIIDSVETLLGDLLVWIVLIPKTLVRGVAWPRSLPELVRSEVERQSSNRYNSYTPPGLFFLLAGVLPYVAGLYTFIPELAAKQAGHLLYRRLAALSPEQALVVGFVYLATLPVGASLVMCSFRHEPLSRSALKPILGIQAYCWGAVLLIGVYPMLIADLVPAVRALRFLAVYWLWFIYQESVIVSVETKAKPFRAVIIALTSWCAAVVLAGAAQIALALAIGGIPSSWLSSRAP